MNSPEDDARAQLKENSSDGAVMLIRLLVPLVPLLGGTISEVICQMIPRQRLDRVIEFVRLLHDDFVAHKKQFNANNEFSIDLLQHASKCAADSVKRIRNKYLLEIMKSSTDVTEDEFNLNKHFLILLSELTDENIAVLGSLSTFEGQGRLRHKVRSRFMSDGDRKRLSFDEKFAIESESARLDVHIAALLRLRLIEPERDTNAIPLRTLGGQTYLEPANLFSEPARYRLTTIGRLLLSRITGKYVD